MPTLDTFRSDMAGRVKEHPGYVEAINRIEAAESLGDLKRELQVFVTAQTMRSVALDELIDRDKALYDVFESTEKRIQNLLECIDMTNERIDILEERLGKLEEPWK